MIETVTRRSFWRALAGAGVPGVLRLPRSPVRCAAVLTYPGTNYRSTTPCHCVAVEGDRCRVHSVHPERWPFLVGDIVWQPDGRIGVVTASWNASVIHDGYAEPGVVVNRVTDYPQGRGLRQAGWTLGVWFQRDPYGGPFAPMLEAMERLIGRTRWE